MSTTKQPNTLADEIVDRLKHWQLSVVASHWVLYVPAERNRQRVQAYFNEYLTKEHHFVYLSATLDHWFPTLEKLALTGQHVRPVVVTSNRAVADGVSTDERWTTYALPLHLKPSVAICNSTQWLAASIPLRELGSTL